MTWSASTHLSLRLVLRVAAKVEPHDLPVSLGGDDNVLWSEVSVHHPHTSVQEAQALCNLDKTVLGLYRVDLVLLRKTKQTIELKMTALRDRKLV